MSSQQSNSHHSIKPDIPFQEAEEEAGHPNQQISSIWCVHDVMQNFVHMQYLVFEQASPTHIDAVSAERTAPHILPHSIRTAIIHQQKVKVLHRLCHDASQCLFDIFLRIVHADSKGYFNLHRIFPYQFPMQIVRRGYFENISPLS